MSVKHGTNRFLPRANEAGGGGSDGIWTLYPGGVIAPTNVSDTVAIGGSTMFAGEKLRVVGDARIEGKLTVTGAIDPTSLSLSGGTALFIDSANGVTAPVSALGHGRIRYNDTTKTWQVSTNGLAYADLATTNAFQQGGNAFGATGVLGTTDGFDLSVVTNGVQRVLLSSAGAFSVTTGTGAISIGADVSNKAITIGAAGNTSTTTIDSGTGTVNAWTSAAIRTTNICTGNAVQTVHIADHATPANLIFIGGPASTTTVGGNIIVDTGFGQFGSAPASFGDIGLVNAGFSGAGDGSTVVDVYGEIEITGGVETGVKQGGFFVYGTLGTTAVAVPFSACSFGFGHGGTGAMGSAAVVACGYGTNPNTGAGVAIGAIATLRGFESMASVIDGLSSSTTSTIDFRAFAPATDATHTIGTTVGFSCDNHGATGITNAIGVDIANQSGAATLNIGLRNAGSTVLTNAITQSGGNVSITAQSGGTCALGNTGGGASMTLDAGTGDVNAWVSAAIRNINVATGNAVQTVHMFDHATPANLVSLGGANTNIGLFRAISAGGGAGVLFVGNATTNPTSNPTAGGILYSNAGAGTWRGSGGTVTAFGPAGPHCGECGYDCWRVAAINLHWKSWHFECAHCGTEYKHGPSDVHGQLSEQQRTEYIRQGADWDEMLRVMKIAA